MQIMWDLFGVAEALAAVRRDKTIHDARQGLRRRLAIALLASDNLT